MFRIKGAAFLAFTLVSMVISTGEVVSQELYGLSRAVINAHKACMDDPRPLFEELPYQEVLPGKVYEHVTFDVEKMKARWAEVVGFQAPDEVGTIAPEIIPGIYTYQDKDGYSFETLMLPRLYERFKPGGPPHAGNFSTIRIIPTRNYYWALPIAEATKKYDGRVQLDENGYLLYDSYNAGYPFPQPSGTFKAQQIMYNWENRYLHADSFYRWHTIVGFNEHLNVDFESEVTTQYVRLHGRLLMEPTGWFDERARKRKERDVEILYPYTPRDQAGAAIFQLSYLDPERSDNWLTYVPFLRRVRKLTQTDTQYPAMGQDLIFDDADYFGQKLTPHRYPYRYEVLEEREYLTFAYSIDGRGYLDSKTKELCDHDFERRPMYVVKLTQLDESYVYGFRIFYIDKETFLIHYVENYDRKGRLYRTSSPRLAFHPAMGMFTFFDGILADHIDLHSTWGVCYAVPTPMLSRSDVSMRAVAGLTK